MIKIKSYKEVIVIKIKSNRKVRVTATHFAWVLERVRDAGPSWAEVDGPAAAGGAVWVAKRGRGCGETGPCLAISIKICRSK